MQKNSGYTLLEFAVVVAIIGIVAGGIFVVQSLIRTSHMNRVLADYDSYVKALAEFQEKFLAMPGDMNGAESMWGTDPGGCPNTPSSTVVKAATCNGNGDGKIGDSTNAGVVSGQREWFRAWQQLSAAGFLNAYFTGTPGPGGVAHAKPGMNVPAASMKGAGWTLYYYQMTAASTPLWADQYGHLVDFGMETGANRTYGGALSANEALSIDKKVDDGKPGRGIIRAWRTALLPNCTVNDTSQDNQAYSISTTANICSLVFLTGI